MKQLFLMLIMLVACGRNPSLGSCGFPQQYYCMDFSEKDDKEILTKKSAKYVCQQLYNGQYNEDPCTHDNLAGVCNLPPSYDINISLVLYTPIWTPTSAKSACDQNYGVFK